MADRNIYIKRLNEARRGGRKIIKGWTITVKYSPNFNDFVASAAEQLQAFVKYNSDRGAWARGFVRQTTHLSLIHRDYMRLNYPSGKRIKLYCILTKRWSATPSQRWALKVEFYQRVGDADFPDDSYEIEPDAQKKWFDSFIARAVGIAQDVTGNRGNRMLEYLGLAERLGYPRYLELWYYHPTAVHEYWVISDEEKKKISNNGKPPFKGTIPGYTQGGGLKWRVYPFKESDLIAHETTTDRDIKSGLIILDAEIIDSIQNLTLRGTSDGSNTAESKLWMDFRKHVSKLMLGDLSHLYYMWNKYPGYEKS
jgi:hypothetical protein